MTEEELATLCADIISYIEHCKIVSMKELITKFKVYDPQEINEAILHLRSENLIQQEIADGKAAFSINETAEPTQVTIEQVNTHVDEIKAKLNRAEITDFDLKISALNKIGEIMADDIQQLLHEICDDLKAARV